MTTYTAYRAQLLYFTGAPNLTLQSHETDPNVHFHADGLIVVEDDKICFAGEYQQGTEYLDERTTLVDWRDKLITAGFIDSHVHYPQTDMIASPAPDLLPWLENYTFPTEAALNDYDHAKDVSEFFIQELLRQGTTTAMVYCTSHKNSVEAFFETSHAQNLRMIAGKVLMDQNCPEAIRDTAQGGIADSENLLQKWHGTGRQLYALTPRFAPTSSREQLDGCAQLAKQYSDIYIQTHVAESKAEIAWVHSLFPEHNSYLDIYDHYGLLRPKAVYGHCIWFDERDRARMRDTQSVAAHCPTSNFFLGSGLFSAKEAEAADMLYSLATDVGAGTSFSLLATMNEAYKVARLQQHYLPALQMFYLCTYGSAKALQLEHQIGTLLPGHEADFVVLDPRATPLLARRAEHYNSLEEMLFGLAMLGDDRAVYATVAGGKVVHQRSPHQTR
ncbi:MAG TPA: guanine deaminase [Candidatus Paenalcaligenes intestinipullorum]|uniref:Guanine deaminase n=1 Tax=Candidatus Paenalcaligenes intestinipullorum TaxID=2838718 RepID=A0A9D2U8Z3_9BURK|nr:guanine deaminase [Candidatus Paenalcaligenes intestinipullorum]